MDVPLFEKCIEYICGKYVVLFEDLVESGNIHKKNNYATIMFDDGYQGNIEYAAPILEKYNCKASFYVITNCIENNIPPWTYVLEYCFEYTNVSNILVYFDFLPKDLRVNGLKTKNERINYVKKLKPFLKKVSHEHRNLVLKTVIETCTDLELPKIMMTWENVIQLKNAGHYIGSHSKTHGVLGGITNENEIREELLDSGQMIESHLGYFPKTISYPVGSYNDLTIKICREVGYEIGLAVKQKIYDPSKESLFEVPRIELYNESWWKTRLRITNVLEDIKSFIGYR